MSEETRPIHFTFEAGELGPTDLLVTSFRGSEGVSELFHFEIELASEDADLDFEAVIGQAGKLVFSEPDGDRYVHGIVSGFEAIGFGRRFARYRATLVPGVWALTLIRRSRIYEELAVPEIIRRVLEADGVPADRFSITADEDHPVREYCVQYRESDWDFLSRLMEDEGFVYFFEQKEDGAVLVIDDRRDVRPDIEGDATIVFRDPGMGVAAQGQIWQFTARREVRPTKVHLREFDFKHPSVDPDEELAADVEPAFDQSVLCDYDYPGGLVENSVGAPLPTFRLEGLRTGDLTMSGESNLPRLRPAHRFTLDGHHREGFNIEYQVIRVVHDGSQEQAAQEEEAEEGHTVYHNNIACIPGDAYWRAPRRTPAPRIRGPQTAWVVGPDGEEIHTDEYGRIRVEFHWSRHDGANDDNSCWIRVSQAWAGPGWGAIFIPRIGHEVVVQFLEGDPDRPLVTGSVYNGANPTPYPLPDEKTKSTIKSDSSLGGGGFNELRFEDAKGSEEIFLHAEKDWNTVVLNDNSESIGHDQSISVKHDRHKIIDNDQTEEVKGNKSTIVRKNVTEEVTQNVSITVTQNRTDHVQGNVDSSIHGNETHSVDGSRTIVIHGSYARGTLGGTQTITSSGDISQNSNTKVALGAPEIVADGGTSVTLKVGGSSITITSASIEIASPRIAINATGALQMHGATVSNASDGSNNISGATVTTQATGLNTVGGANVEVSGSAGVKISGASVEHNG
jgi:type VI secretion system secreted protein VgrG